MADDPNPPSVKVVDRRWWARESAGSEGDAAEAPSLKPSYVEELEARIAEKDRTIQEYLTKYREAAREFEESRARLRREVAKDVARGRRAILAELVEVVDNLDLALEASKDTGNVEALRQGIDLVRRQFLSKLEGLDVRRIDPLGQPFDPAVHEAVSTVPATADVQDGTVAGVIRPAYVIGDEVLRPALVAVARTQRAKDA